MNTTTAPAAALDNTLGLHTAIVDAIHGYEKMLEKAEPSFRPVVTELLDLNRTAAADIERALRENGTQPDNDGSLMSAVHRTVVTMRSVVDDIDAGVIPQIVDGEQRILGKYDDAIAEAGAVQSLGATLQQRRARLAELVARLQDAQPRS
jgi:uncharacterized protein (TIGR02284 family)